MFVYGIRFGKYVKIGCSESPADRIRALPGNMRRPVDLAASDVEPLFSVPGDYTTERFLHDLFAPYRAIGEWYHHEPMAEMLDRVRAVQRSADSCLPDARSASRRARRRGGGLPAVTRAGRLLTVSREEQV